MTRRKFSEDHNQIAFLQKVLEAEGFTEVIDFLNASQLRYALTVNPTIYKSNMRAFWSTVTAETRHGEDMLVATVDEESIVVTEASVRRILRLKDDDGTTCLSTSTIFEELAKIGYERQSDNVKFFKRLLCPQWKFLLHTIQHCLSPKTTRWNEFSASQASALICLATGQPFNFSAMIFEGMKKNISGKFYMYPRFLQLIINSQLQEPLEHNGIEPSPMMAIKMFAFLRKKGKGFSGNITPLSQHILDIVAATNEGEEAESPT